MSSTVFPCRESSGTHTTRSGWGLCVACSRTISGNSCLLHKNCCIKFHLLSFYCWIWRCRNTQMHWYWVDCEAERHRWKQTHTKHTNLEQTNTQAHTHLPVSLGIFNFFSSSFALCFLFFLSFHWSHLSTICSSIQQHLRPRAWHRRSESM